jgi:hypothetical protein
MRLKPPFATIVTLDNAAGLRDTVPTGKMGECLKMANIVNSRLSATQTGDEWKLTLNWTTEFHPAEVNNDFEFATNWTLKKRDVTNQVVTDDYSLIVNTVEKWFRPEGNQAVDHTETLTFRITNPDELGPPIRYMSQDRLGQYREDFTYASDMVRELGAEQIIAEVHLYNVSRPGRVTHSVSNRLSLNPDVSRAQAARRSQAED